MTTVSAATHPLLGLLGIALPLAFGVVERRALAWYHQVQQAKRGGDQPAPPSPEGAAAPGS